MQNSPPMHETNSFEYLTVISLPLKIRNEIQLFKEMYGLNFGHAKYLNSQAHITLCHFNLLASRENVLRKELTQYLGDFGEFKTSLSGFFSFETNGLLYIKPEKDRIIGLQRYMADILRNRMHVPKRQTQVLREPHITIAVANTKEQYQKSWSHFKKISYQNELWVNRFTVLKRRPIFEKAKYELAFEISIGIKPAVK